MKAIRYTPILFLLFAVGCGTFSRELVRHPARVIVMTEHAPVYAMNADASAGSVVGTLAARAGDTIDALGTYGGGIGGSTYYVVLSEGREVYVEKGDVLTESAHLWSRSTPNFRLKWEEDRTAWARATAYIVHHSGTRIRIASDNLIQTATPVDSVSIGYIVTRVPTRDWVEYSITLQSKQKGFDSITSARRMAYYMASGREY